MFIELQKICQKFWSKNRMYNKTFRLSSNTSQIQFLCRFLKKYLYKLQFVKNQSIKLYINTL